MPARHRAPRRSIVKVERTSGYGKTRYHHHLDCGHTVVARRPSPNPTVGCVACIEAERLAAILSEPDRPLVDLDASVDIDAARLRAGLAKLLACDLEDVRIDIGYGPAGPRMSGVSIYLSVDSLEALRPRLL